MIRRPVVHWHYLAEPYTILYLSRAVSYSKPYRNLDCLSEYTAVDTIQVFKYVLLTDVYIYIYIYSGLEISHCELYNMFHVTVLAQQSEANYFTNYEKHS